MSMLTCRRILIIEDEAIISLDIEYALS